jgi:sugar-specific transcriptional regulator TrmB
MEEINSKGKKSLLLHKMTTSLLELGLNKYEEKVYLTLIEEGVSSAKNISNITGIPYGSV